MGECAQRDWRVGRSCPNASTLQRLSGRDPIQTRIAVHPHRRYRAPVCIGGLATIFALAIAGAADASVIDQNAAFADLAGHSVGRSGAPRPAGLNDAVFVAGRAGRPSFFTAFNMPGSLRAARAVFVPAAADRSGLTVEDVSGEAGAAIPLKIQIGKFDPEQYSFLMIRGLPQDFSLSVGFRLKDRWAVSLRDIGKLTLFSPAGYKGAVELEILVVRSQDKPVERHVMTVSIGGTAESPAATGAIASPVSKPEPEPRNLATRSANQGAASSRQPPVAIAKDSRAAPAVTISAQEEASVIERVKQMLANGDIASSRLLLEFIAKKGSAKGAVMLGQTYDPAFLQSISALGLRPDLEKAREWYTLASELGDETARARLTALTALTAR
jgi:hypothetical protein